MGAEQLAGKPTITTNKQEQTVPCSSCKEPIKVGAKICYHCSHYQDIRQYMSWGQSSLTLVLALVAVISAAAPLWLALAGGPRSDLVVTSAHVNTNGADVTVANLGDRAGIVNGVYVSNLMADEQRHEFVAALDLFVPQNELRHFHLTSPVYPPGSLAELTETFVRLEAEFDDDPTTFRQCDIVVELQDFGGDSSDWPYRHFCIALWGAMFPSQVQRLQEGIPNASEAFGTVTTSVDELAKPPS